MQTTGPTGRATETRTCTPCGRPANGPTTPVNPNNPAAGRVALLHPACYRQLVTAVSEGQTR